MKLRDGLVYRNGQLSGYQEVGDVNKALMNATEQSCSFTALHSSMATHALAFIIQGLKEHINYPVAVYGTRGSTSSELYHMFWDIVGHLELVGIRVRAFVCDGASSNRRMFKIRKDDFPNDEIVYRCHNKFAERTIYFVSDVPHLIKTTRNCWENSGSNLKSRQLMVCFTLVLHTIAAFTF